MKQRLMPYIELDRQDLAAIQAGQPFIVSNAGNESVILRFVANGHRMTLAKKSIDGPPVYECRTCDPPRIFLRSRSLSAHMRAHKDRAPMFTRHRRRFSDRDWKKFAAYYKAHGWTATATKFELSSSTMQQVLRMRS